MTAWSRCCRCSISLLGFCLALAVSGCGARIDAPENGPVAMARAALDGPACSATGAHQRHATFACTVCHSVGGSLCFDPAGPAYAAGQPAPGFDFTAKTCSSVGCHGMYSGVYTYEVWDWGCDCAATVQAPYQGSGGNTPSWYTVGAGCSACHGNPPGAYPTWHGWHANRSFAGSNDCQLCHPDAIGSDGVGTGFNTAPCTVNGVFYASCAVLHANGTLNVNPRYRPTPCFSCH